ncbi:hypothetical protein QTL86_06600 [Cellulosilyticum sp. ST5]|uniref:hypothetical protein n=1 Tax=unclassified Cellulosilyticum TaxID=2643091 RepID=UPI001FA9A7EA|nr:hypothetical protein [Cellulosilyticum sp. WCF-2]
MIKGAILEKGEVAYTYLKKIFKSLDNFQRSYNWLITGYESFPFSDGHLERIFQSGNYAWISGEELTGIINKNDFQWNWAVLSGFDKCYTLQEVLKYDLPYADCNKAFWQENISIQHPLASVEIVAFDSSLTLLISSKEELVKKFRKAFPLSKDLKEYNTKDIDDSIEYEKWLIQRSNLDVVNNDI